MATNTTTGPACLCLPVWCGVAISKCSSQSSYLIEMDQLVFMVLCITTTDAFCQVCASAIRAGGGGGSATPPNDVSADTFGGVCAHKRDSTLSHSIIVHVFFAIKVSLSPVNQPAARTRTRPICALISSQDRDTIFILAS